MDQPLSVWDFSDPSMHEIGLPHLVEPEATDLQEALCVFNMPTMPSLFDDTDGTVAAVEEPQQSIDRDSPRQRVRRSVSLEQKQASNREHQRKFRERSKVIEKDMHPVCQLTAEQILASVGGYAAQHACSYKQQCVHSVTCECPAVQARSQAIEAQLTRTTNELRDLKSRHAELEAVLERAHQSSQDQLSHSSSETQVLSSLCHTYVCSTPAVCKLL